VLPQLLRSSNWLFLGNAINFLSAESMSFRRHKSSEQAMCYKFSSQPNTRTFYNRPIPNKKSLPCSSLIKLTVLGGLLVACLPLDPRFASSNPAGDDGFSKAIKIYSTTSFGRKIKPSVLCPKILRYVENATSMKEILRSKN
jgi:hypothetical protein